MSPVREWIVSIPATDPASARPEILQAAAAGATVVEIRFDLWSPAARERAGELFPAPVPLLGTLRSALEGGRGPDDPEERSRALVRLGGHPFRYLDVEVARDLPIAPPSGGAALLGSRHLPARATLAEIDAAARATVPGVERQKVVVVSNVERYLADLQPRLRGWISADRAFFTTGPSGSFARLAAEELRQPFVFAALPMTAAPSSSVEPSQVPVDRLRSAVAGKARCWFAVVGTPIAHSLSPYLHDAWFAADGRAAAFVPVEIRSEQEFDRFLEEARSGRWLGWSVTAPWKRLAAERADRRSPAVGRTEVANSLRFGADGIEAEQTDGVAIHRRLGELVSDLASGKPSVLVVGTGGAARAAVESVASLARETLVIGRRPPVVLGLAQRMGATAVTPRDARPVDFVVHATTAGRSGSGPLEPPLDGWLDARTTILDLVYGAEDPSLAQLAARRGARYEDGRRILVYQAEAAYAWWWGHRPPAAATERILREIGCAG